MRRLGYEAEVAGKTGTTSGFRDAWFIGFSPSLLVAVWIGFDDGASLGIPGSVAALPIFADFSLELHGPRGESTFVDPAGLERVEIHRETGLRAGRGCSGAPEYFLKGTAPLERCGPQTSGGVERMIDWLRGRLSGDRSWSRAPWRLLRSHRDLGRPGQFRPGSPIPRAR